LGDVIKPTLRLFTQGLHNSLRVDVNVCHSHFSTPVLTTQVSTTETNVADNMTTSRLAS